MKQMASSDIKDVCIAGNSSEGEIDVKLVARVLLSILLLATKIVSAATITTNLRVSWPSSFLFRICGTKKR